MKSWVLTLGLGVALGAVAILMIPRDNVTRRLATQAACKVEDAAHKFSNKLNVTDNIC